MRVARRATAEGGVGLDTRAGAQAAHAAQDEPARPTGNARGGILAGRPLRPQNPRRHEPGARTDVGHEGPEESNQGGLAPVVERLGHGAARPRGPPQLHHGGRARLRLQARNDMARARAVHDRHGQNGQHDGTPNEGLTDDKGRR